MGVARLRGSRSRASLVLVGVGAASLVAATMLAGSASAAPAPKGTGTLSASPISGGTTIQGAKSASGRLAKSNPALLKLTGTAPTSVIVKLDYDALGSYAGNVRGYAATSPQVTHKPLNVKSAAAVSYGKHITAMENSFRSALTSAVPSAKVGTTYHTVYGGLAVRVPANKVAGLLNLPGAVAIQADTLHKLDAATVSDDDASFIGGQAAYNALGSSATAGKGILVADVDTGVWPEHPSFAARSDLGTPPPTPDGHARACNFGTNPLPGGTAFACNNKLIEGQVFLDNYNSRASDELYPTTARDSNGHGTHTTSTAAGNPLEHAVLLGVDRGPIQGIAPGSFVMAYKALGPQGGFDSDLVAAINQAVLDGANVINYSIGPSTPQSAYTSPDDLAFLDAFDAGVFVSASAGNSGPGPQTTSHLGPWETTVGASTLKREFDSTATLTAPGAPNLVITGSSIMGGIATPTSVVNATSLAGYNALCNAPAPPGSFTGKIVVCVRGGNGRVEKGFNVKQGGAAGMFLINPAVQDTETDNHYLPAVHFDAPAGNQLEAYLAAHPGATATFTAGQKAFGRGDVMAAFSSRGPGGDFLKPDITAPGVQILAGNTPTPTDVASGPSGQYFQAIAGTSMSAPHITGSGAIVLALHPSFTPAEVKSVLMMTASQNVVEQDGTTPAKPFDDGSGRVDLAGTVDPGLTLNVTKAEMDAVLTDPVHRIDLNEPSVYDASLPGKVTTTRRFKNVDAHPEAYTVSVKSDIPGAITVSPSVINIAPGQVGTITITLDGTNGNVGTFYNGEIDLTQSGGPHRLHLPVVFSPSSASTAPSGLAVSSSCTPSSIKLAVTPTTCTATVQNNSRQVAPVTATMNWTDNLQLLSVGPGGTRSGRGASFGPVNLAAAQPAVPHVASGASPAGYLDLADFGVPQQALGDDAVTNFTVPAFQYDGVSYTRLGVGTNGDLIVGGGDATDASGTPQIFPNPVRPNNVLAPLWTDLDGGDTTATGEGLRIGTLGDGTNNWIVVQWNVHVYGQSAKKESFQAWLGYGGPQDISYTYGPTTAPGQPCNVGAENSDGTAGNNVACVPSGDQVVTSTPGAPGGSATFSVTLRGVKVGTGTVETDVSSPIIRDTVVSKTNVTIIR